MTEIIYLLYSIFIAFTTFLGVYILVVCLSGRQGQADWLSCDPLQSGCPSIGILPHVQEHSYCSSTLWFCWRDINMGGKQVSTVSFGLFSETRYKVLTYNRGRCIHNCVVSSAGAHRWRWRCYVISSAACHRWRSMHWKCFVLSAHGPVTPGLIAAWAILRL